MRPDAIASGAARRTPARSHIARRRAPEHSSELSMARAEPTARGALGTLSHGRTRGLTAQAEEPPDEPAQPAATVLILFAGPGGRVDGLAAALRRLGLEAVEIDTKIGFGDHDLTKPCVAGPILAAIRGGAYAAVFIATPCCSYSVAHRPKLRSREHPEGLPTVPAEWRRYLAKHNALAAFTAAALVACQAAHVPCAVENPADRGIEGTPQFWRKHRDHGSLWRQECMVRAIGAIRGVSHTLAQCAFGAGVQKWTTIVTSALGSEHWAGLSARQCTHGGGRHPQQAYGRDDEGRPLAEMAAAYPPEMNEWLARTLACAARDAMGAECGEAVVGGRVADGAKLSPSIARMCEEARLTPPPFASARNLLAAAEASLRIEALPGDLHTPMQPSKPKAKRGKGKAHPAACSAVAGSSADDIRPEGKIGVAQLFYPGVYAEQVESWLELADVAARDIVAGRTPKPVPTRVIGQASMPAWARGVVWDCTDPGNCQPVVRSDRSTVFPGPKQIDRAALRAAADALDWHDADIVGQVGEGGVEARSSCPLDTVLAFHHKGLIEQADAAAKVVEADWAEQWATRPVRHLPMVPCRLLPRNVVLQERTRVHDDGRIEHFLKPRVSQDSSDGAVRSPNAGVARHETALELPTVQEHGRAVCICDTATLPVGDGDVAGCEAASSSDVGARRARASQYVVDATSAFRYCPMNWADVWTQCFVWWAVVDGVLRVGICIDTHMAFGGAYSPNRFERVSMLAAAWIQCEQAEFDAVHPLPAQASEWRAQRRRQQACGELPTGEAQLEPRHLQVFIDDFMGVALDDPVAIDPDGRWGWVLAVEIDPRLTRAVGGEPAASGTRVHAHAAIAIQRLASVGLCALATKSLLGDPVVALGLRTDRARGRLDCPPAKRITVRAEIASALQLAHTEPPSVDVPAAERLVGRLGNLSQAFPEIKPFMHGGHAVSSGVWRWAGRGKRLCMRRGSRAHEAWTELLLEADALLEANEGVALAPQLAFPSRAEAGVATSTTDASGVDGVGGYVFLADQPGRVWLVSEPWPADIKRALERASTEREIRARDGLVAQGEGGSMLSMPAAELFGMMEIPRAVAAAVAAEAQSRAAVTAVVAVGDCDPACNATNAAKSRNPQMRELLGGGRGLTSQWLAVSVPRDANGDADRLSHPELYEIVRAEAEAAGLHVSRARLSEENWDRLRAAARLRCGVEGAQLQLM